MTHTIIGFFKRSCTPRPARRVVRATSMITKFVSRKAILVENARREWSSPNLAESALLRGLNLEWFDHWIFSRPFFHSLRMWTPLDVPLTGEKPFTDYSRWRLVVNDGGRHTWEYLRTDEEVERWPQTDLDKFWLGQKLVCRF